MSTLAPEGHSSPTTHRLIGARVGDRYELVRLIAVGAVGQVFEARQVALQRKVAVKLVSFPHGADAGEQARRFALEGETLARLSHPNVVSIFDVGVWKGQGFIVMELLKGRTLAEVFESSGRLPLPRLIHIARQLCAALDATHRAGVIHRDLKPSNVLLTTVGHDEDFVKIVDFGIVKDLNADHQLTVQGTPLGTPRYMSPEQVTGAAESIGPATDIYSLGAMLYRGAIGQTMFPNAQGMFQLIAQLREPPPTFTQVLPDHGIPASFEDVVRRCLAKQPDERHASALELDMALERVEQEIGALLPDRPRPVPLTSRNRYSTHDDADLEKPPLSHLATHSGVRWVIASLLIVMSGLAIGYGLSALQRMMAQGS